jgi:hypothetical protein
MTDLIKKKAIHQKKINSLVSAQKFKCSSLAQLETIIAWLGSAWKIPARTHH